MQKTVLKGSRLSLQQIRLWSMQQENTIYHAQCAILLEGKLDVATLRQSMQEIFSQHEILQSIFYHIPGMDLPLLKVEKESQLFYAETHLETMSIAEQDAQIERLFQATREEPFDLANGPLLRSRLLRLAVEKHLLVLTLPALCADTPTLQLLMTKISQAYAACIDGETLPDEVLQYADISAWQNSLLQEDDAEEYRAHWSSFDLAHVDPLSVALKLPEADRQSRTEQAFNPQTFELAVETKLFVQLQEQALRTGIPLETWLLTCWQLLIGHLTNEDTILLGVACDGRHYDELAGALGLCSRFVPFSTLFIPDEPFTEMLTQVDKALEEAREEQEYFTWDLLATPADKPTEPAFFPISFEWEHWPDALHAPGLRFSLFSRRACFERFTLKLTGLQLEQRLQLELSYDQAHLNTAQIQRIGAALLTILEASLMQPQLPLGQFPLLSTQQQHELLQHLQGPSVPVQAQSFQQLFAEQVDRYPTEPALVCGSLQLSYQQLDARTTHLAQELRQQGIGSNVLVALCLPRSAEMIVGLLAILKAGGAYLPLDPETPLARLAAQWTQSQARLLLTQHTLREALASFPGPMLCLDEWMQRPSSEAQALPPLEQADEPDQLAYVIYTSGSTGGPKGVMIQQRSVVNYTQALCTQLEAQAGWHYATVSTLAADLGNTAIFCALASGGCLHILPYDVVTDGNAFAHYLQDHPIDVLKIVPSHLSALLASSQQTPILPRRWLILGGEVLPPHLLNQVHQSDTTCQVLNHYGPTEATIGALVNSLGHQPRANQEAEALPLGLPIANMACYILNRYQQLLPVGVIGELYLSGVGLAQGYLGQPEQTQQRFLSAPQHSDKRIYRTGDLAYVNEEGLVVYVGRADQQVKLRGYRIELAEIEATLRTHEQVRQAVVIVRTDGNGEPRLLAYVVGRQPGKPGSLELLEHIRIALPEYMVPTQIVFLAELPLTRNGKIDRQSLPEPEQAVQPVSIQDERPYSPIEEGLLPLWEEMLAIRPLQLNADFFALGGHSLLATRLIARVRHVFDVEIPILKLFEAPTVAQFAPIVQQTLRQRQGQALEIPPLQPTSRQGDLLLSFAQQRLWFLDQLEPGSTTYNIPQAVLIAGPLQIQALEQSLDEIVRRHESLRTSFQMRNGQPVQVIALERGSGMRHIILHDLDAAQREAQAHLLAQQEAMHPFDLQQGPLLRATLLHLSKQEHILCLTLHHIVSDGWSTDIVLHELQTLYAAFVAGTPSPLPELTIHYADYAIWQRSWLQGQVLKQQLAYWKTQLAHVQPLELPTDAPRPAEQRYQGHVLAFQLPASLSADLKALSLQAGTTLFMTLLASFQLLLARWSGQDDITVGSPIANRTHSQLEVLIGFFVNTLVLRTDLSGNPSFLQLLQRVREVCLGAYAHQDVPFEHLVEELQPQRDLSRSPLFQVLFVLQQASQSRQSLAPDLSLHSLDLEGRTAKFDLTWEMEETVDGLQGWVEYNTDLFTASTIQRWLQHWQTLLTACVQQPEAPIRALPLLSTEQRQQILSTWNATQVDYPAPFCLHELIQEQVARSPQAIALVFEDEQISYQCLNTRANQLAHYLRMLGVGPETPVGICLPRSLDLVVGLLAILKAGGAYVPLDPSYPVQRLTYLIADAHVPLLLTTEPLRTQLPLQETRVLCFPELWSACASLSSIDPDWSSHPDSLAYIIYTSGSTGQPKGAMNTHRGIVNRLRWMQQTYQLTSADRVVQKTPFSFDVSVWEFFWPLFSGARLVVALPEGHRDPHYLAALLHEQAITTIHFVPSMLQIFLQEPALPTHTQSLRRVICSGEAFPVEVQERCLSLLGSTAQLYNLYGPTEAAVDVTAWHCRSDQAAWTVPIGFPIANLQIYLLDPQMQPVPIGVPGELSIGGVGVGRGYWLRGGLTAERFVPDPFSLQPGSRLYRSGDLACYREDGRIEYIGRIDEQVKLRGYRIELGEIETVLVQHPTVRTTVVLLQEGTTGDQHLVAYIVSKQSGVLQHAELRTHLQTHLPEYMVPTHFILLDELPLSPNGKIDRRALPALELQANEANTDNTTPRTAFEEIVSQVWSQILSIPQPNIHDNFFILGGHSLLATQVIGRLRTLLQVELPLRSLFEAPTIAGLARHIEEIRRTQSEQMLPALQAIDREGDLLLSFAQQRLWFLDQLEPGTATYNIPAAVHMQGHLHVRALERSLDEIVRRHESLRTSFQMRNGQPVQVIAPEWVSGMHHIVLHDIDAVQREAQAHLLALQEAMHPFDLQRGPLIRATLLHLADEEHILCLTLHHIVSDGWSTDVLVRELQALYSAYIADAPSSLPDLAMHYADYAAWQRSWLQGEVLERQLAYWRHQLRDSLPLELPFDHPHPALQTFNGARQSLTLPRALCAELVALSQRENVTLFMLLLAAFQVLLARYAGQDDICVGTPIANRTLTELEGLIGFFANTLVLRSNLSGNPDFVEVLRRVREVALAAYAHQDVPFEQLVDLLQPQRDLSRPPLFQVGFQLQQGDEASQQLDELILSRLEVEHTTSKFEIALTIFETSGDFQCEVEYNTDLFEADTISRLLEHWHMLLKEVIAHPHHTLAELSFLTEIERLNLLVEWNKTQTQFPDRACLHTLFAEQADKTPDAIVLIDDEHYLSYAALQRGAQQLAQHLITFGLEPQARVAVCLPRSIMGVTAILGLLQAGGVFVPLDSVWPAERLTLLLEETQTAIILTQQSMADRFAETAVPLINLDQHWNKIIHAPEQPVKRTLPAEALAYIIYTSGSTGKPKGVMVPHNAILNRLYWGVADVNLQASDIVGQVASWSFDIALWELFGPWLVGGTCLLISADEVRDTRALARRVGEANVTVLHLVPSLLSVVLQEPDFATNRSIRCIQTGGEAVSRELINRTYAVKGVAVHQFYGPTEASISVTGWRGQPGEVNKRATIGKPIANTKIYLVDHRGGLVAPGMPGEIWIGGENLAWGYWQHGDWTGERFVPDSFSDQPGARLYRTGDVARYLPDGDIEFVGRSDAQIKIRGHRIEPGEIEAVLLAHAGIHMCVVLLRENQAGDRFLVAYVVGEQTGRRPEAQQLRLYLRSKLPDYMLPAHIVVLDQLPLNANGKIDRPALPSPDLVSAPESNVALPHTPLEDLLSTIWSEVLGQRQIGLHEDFFASGGHSLLATRLIMRIREVLQLELPLRLLFEYPTIAQFAAEVENIYRGEYVQKMPPLLPVARTEQLMLSFAQQRLWFLDQLEPGSTTYNVPAAVRMQGNLHSEALHHSLDEIVRRHESLRTTFQVHNDLPVQIIAPARGCGLQHVDLQKLSRAEREEEAQRLVQQEAVRPFDLQHGPLIRVLLLHLDTEEHILCLTMQHIVSDGWSTNIFVHELCILYSAYTTGQPSPLLELPIQYADYANWQRSWLQDNAMEQQMAYWQRQLAAITPLELPTDYPRPSIQGSTGAVERILLSAQLSEELKALSRHEGTTLFMTLLAAFNVLLSRYSEQTDIAVGTIIANRNRPEIVDVIGFFVNTLVLRTDLSANPTFQDLLKRVREVALGAYTHQDLPFEKLVETLQPERDLGRSPLFQVLFTLHSIDPLPQDTLDLTLSDFALESATAKFDLGLTVTDQGKDLLCAIEYNTDLFAPHTIAKMLMNWQTLLAAVSQQQTLRIHELPILDEKTRGQLLVEWNATQADYPQDVCIHHLFEAQVERTPDAVAVTFEEQHLTYQQLNADANSLAHYLHTHGVDAGSMVAISLKRSLLMVISVLGVLKAGAAYLPLAPDYPQERLEYMLRDARVAVVLTQQQLVASIPVSAELHTICLDTEEMAASLQGHRENGDYALSNVAVAYIIYTSGSTGQPKGVMVTHKALVNYTLDIVPQFHLHARDRFLQFASLSFDVSVEELFPSWLCGATLVLCQEQDLLAPVGLTHIIEREGVTIVELPTAYWHEWVRELVREERSLPPFLRAVIIGGELVLPDSLIAWQHFAVTLFHVYGLTEVTVTSTVYTYQQHLESQLTTSVFPIGYPIANTRLYVLDSYQQPVPVGVPGELYIGGESLALGYFNKPALTATRFVPDPFAHETGARLYKTGDLVRYLPNGTLDFLGRRDQQIKLRGFRIELGEIEAALVAHSAVHEAVVTVRETASGHKALVGYIVLAAEKAVSPSTLQAFLKGRLPEYMIPSIFINLSKLPLSPNGKIDRRALPAPDWDALATDSTVLASRTPIEEIMQNIWSEVLDRTDIGTHANFFDMGGHSLLITQMLARVNAQFHVHISIRSVFEAPLLSSLAERVQLALQDQQGIAAPPILPVSRASDLPLSFAQQRLWFLNQLEPENVSYNIPMAVTIQGALHIYALEQSLDTIIQRHESLRTTFHLQDGEPVQVVGSAQDIVLHHIALQDISVAERKQQVQLLTQQEALQPFDLEHGPLIRITLLHLAPGEYRLLATMHHIVSDGWSNNILESELSALYSAFVAGEPSPLAELSIQYADYACWQRSWLQGAVLRKQLDYWQEQLVGARPLALPTDFPRASVRRNQGALHRFHLPALLSQELLALSRQEGVTLFMTLLATFQTLLYRWSGQTDLVVGTDFANRNHVETEKLIGFFINLLVLRTQVQGTTSFRAVLHAVRETVLGAYTHQETPFELLIDHLGVERNLNQTPLVQVLFVLQNTPISPVTPLAHISLQPVESAVTGAKFDLAVFLSEETDGLHGAVNYSCDLFSAQTIERMMQRFVLLLHGIVADRETPLDLLPFVTANEQEQSHNKKQKQRRSMLEDLKTSKRDFIQLTEKDSHE